MFTLEDIMNALEEDVNKMWKFHSEQFKLKMWSLEVHLLLLQLNYLHCSLRIWKLFPVQFEVIFLVQIWKYWI
jgi:hypothetical protein